jgi:uncharacterized RDD family membrane protein YckC
MVTLAWHWPEWQSANAARLPDWQLRSGIVFEKPVCVLPAVWRVCRCVPEIRPAQSHLSMKSRFEPECSDSPDAASDAMLVDQDALDVSEQPFSASLEEKSRPRFVVDDNANQVAGGRSEESAPCALPPATSLDAPEPASAPPDLQLEPTPGSWRHEVAARVNKYRARRPTRGPRYPSLRLQFEEPEWKSHPRTEGTLASQPEVVPEQVPAPAIELSSIPAAQPAPSADTAKILEFPRSFAPPPRPLDELADPVIDRPRILEVPDVVPPPPALGGILIEAPEEKDQEKRPGFEIPLQPARMSRRLLASGIDAVIVASSFALFAYIFFRVTKTIPPLPQLLAASAGLLGLFWATYQYLLLVHSGATPGLMLTKLELNRFDGGAARRSLRRWRVLASVLSSAPLGLGYAWCFLDEDQLCWHDRITHTYIAPRRSA